VDRDQLRGYCLDKPGAVDEYPFGPDALVIKVLGKMFALIAEDAEPVRISLKCDPELAVVLRDNYDAVTPGYHLNKRHWNTVIDDGSVTDDELRDWIDDSYDLVVAGLPRKDRDTLGAKAR
jgi:predicted DNA-binding protein (MmcQ/YjbR family)